MKRSLVMWNFLVAIVISSSLCAAQVPAGATLYLSRASQGQQQGGHECSENDYKMLETEIPHNKVPLTLVGNEADAAYDIKCVAPDDIVEMMRAVLTNQRLKFAKAIAVRDNKTKRVVWTYTCAGGMEWDLPKCLAKHLKDAPNGAGEDIQAQYGDRGTALHIASFRRRA
jgi:hypothetical protein